MEGINKFLYKNKDNTSLPLMLTTDEIMNYLRIKDIRTLKKIIKNEQLPYLKINNALLFPSDKIREWIDGRTIK